MQQLTGLCRSRTMQEQEVTRTWQAKVSSHRESGTADSLIEVGRLPSTEVCAHALLLFLGMRTGRTQPLGFCCSAHMLAHAASSGHASAQWAAHRSVSIVSGALIVLFSEK